MTITNSRQLASVIAAMPFRELLDVAKALVEMNEDPEVMDRDPKTPLGMAETLSDWAGAELEDD